MRYRQRVYTYALSKLGDRFDAEDVTQEVFAAVRQGLGRYEAREGTPFRAWLFTIARNQIARRRMQRSRIRPVEPFKLDLVPALVGTSSTIATDWLDHQDLSALVEALPTAQRQVLTLRFLLDRSIIETAQILGRTATDISTIQGRALRALRVGLTDSASANRPRTERSARRARPSGEQLDA